MDYIHNCQDVLSSNFQTEILIALHYLALWDYDGYDYLSMDMSLKDVLNDPSRPMGHAFVLASLIQDEFKRAKKASPLKVSHEQDKFQERS